ncbi:MAG: SDR family oxidoreductase [Acidimicrobiia bacterium]|nr:SDR family oxidoreductase [Acidimicrobiia bacterium]
MNRLAERSLVVTGATGIAAAGADRFAREGGTVFVISLRRQDCEMLVSSLPGAGHGFATADLADEPATEAAFAAATEHLDGLDGLFAVAGGSGRADGDGPAAAIPLAGWEATLDRNLTTSFLAMREALRRMGPGGSVVVVSSVLADHPSARFSTHAYAAAKGAQLALVRAAAAHYATAGIRINALQPGLVRTPMSERAQADSETMSYIARKQPLTGGIVEAADVAAAAAFLLSDDARTITGQALAVDGGWSVTEAE